MYRTSTCCAVVVRLISDECSGQAFMMMNNAIPLIMLLRKALLWSYKLEFFLTSRN